MARAWAAAPFFVLLVTTTGTILTHEQAFIYDELNGNGGDGAFVEELTTDVPDISMDNAGFYEGVGNTADGMQTSSTKYFAARPSKFHRASLVQALSKAALGKSRPVVRQSRVVSTPNGARSGVMPPKVPPKSQLRTMTPLHKANVDQLRTQVPMRKVVAPKRRVLRVVPPTRRVQMLAAKNTGTARQKIARQVPKVSFGEVVGKENQWEQGPWNEDDDKDEDDEDEREEEDREDAAAALGDVASTVDARDGKEGPRTDNALAPVTAPAATSASEASSVSAISKGATVTQATPEMAADVANPAAPKTVFVVVPDTMKASEIAPQVGQMSSVVVPETISRVASDVPLALPSVAPNLQMQLSQVAPAAPVTTASRSAKAKLMERFRYHQLALKDSVAALVRAEEWMQKVGDALEASPNVDGIELTDSSPDDVGQQFGLFPAALQQLVDSSFEYMQKASVVKAAENATMAASGASSVEEEDDSNAALSEQTDDNATSEEFVEDDVANEEESGLELASQEERDDDQAFEEEVDDDLVAEDLTHGPQ
eukprot:TRINITY_DN44024_c0_g1_i1.p1 TRINITY_DN44024_c0_g1~~TRINITY_DN44024_c0_g1_i1.p1  ORF type:complete len:557 (-),score=121.11 TRINITY_DN44024_c0_g1_i1:159-1784(-)